MQAAALELFVGVAVEVPAAPVAVCPEVGLSGGAVLAAVLTTEKGVVAFAPYWFWY